jgi:hypothetical protein
MSKRAAKRARRKLAIRRADYDQKRLSPEKGFKRPGSLQP